MYEKMLDFMFVFFFSFFFLLLSNHIFNKKTQFSGIFENFLEFLKSLFYTLNMQLFRFLNMVSVKCIVSEKTYAKSRPGTPPTSTSNFRD